MNNEDEEALECIRQCGADENLQRVLREFGAGEELEKAIREGDSQETQRNATRGLRKFALVQAMGEARRRKAGLDSIAESPVWKDPQFVNKLSYDFIAKYLEKSRETTKHYIDAAPHISKMGNPRKGVDGRVLRDKRGVVLWDADPTTLDPQTRTPASETQQAMRTIKHLRASQASGELSSEAACCANCIMYPSQANPCPIVGGGIDPTSVICDLFKAKQSAGNMSACGKIDVTKSLMGNPVRQADGSVKWIVK